MRTFFNALLFVFALSTTQGQVFIDTVHSFTPGTVQFTGQSSEYFPENIFGAPYESATRFVPASLPDDVCSIGRDGEIIVGIRTGTIFNGPGSDFIIFENAFEREFDGVVFAEPAKISVSSDGVNFIEFPYDELTLEGLAGKTPTIGSADPFNPILAGGDAFDLNDLGLEGIKYIKIKDISYIVTSDANHAYYQPDVMVTGFDLDAVAVLYDKFSTLVQEIGNNFVLSESNEAFFVKSDSEFSIQIYDILGNELHHASSHNQYIIDKNSLPRTVLLVRIVFDNQITVKVLNNI